MRGGELCLGNHRLKYLLGLVRVEGLGPVRINKLLTRFSSPKEVWDAPAKKLREIEGIGESLAGKISSSRGKIDLEYEWDQAKNAGVQVLSAEEELYPNLLKETYTPPVLLFCKGNLEILKNPMLAVVGTRSSTRYGYEVLKKIIPDLCRAGIAIVSGMARGIDGIAHELCLKNGGKTVAVLGGGIDRIYPPEHNELYKKISKEGLILSEYPIGQTPMPGNFPARNRIISGLSKAILVVEAPRKSGAMITAEFALEQNKDVLVIPGNITNPKSEGCNKLLFEGAKPVLNSLNIIEEFHLNEVASKAEGIEETGKKIEKFHGVAFETNKLKVLEKIPQYPYKLHMEELLLECKLNYEVFIQEILELELNGYIIKQAGGHISRIK